MNVITTTGSVHMAASAKNTKCHAHIGALWQPTDAPLTCRLCQAKAARQPFSGMRAPEVITLLDWFDRVITQYQHDQVVTKLLHQLNCRIADELLVIQLMPDKPDVTVTIRKSELTAWCERRIESRKTHTNKALRGGSGPPSVKTIRVM
jgi:hypothetical protein